MRYRVSMQRLVGVLADWAMILLVLLLLSSSCLEPEPTRGDPCLADHLGESECRRTGVCATQPGINETSNLSPPTDATSNVLDAQFDAPDEAEPDEAEPDGAEDAPNGVQQGTTPSGGDWEAEPDLQHGPVETDHTKDGG